MLIEPSIVGNQWAVSHWFGGAPPAWCAKSWRMAGFGSARHTVRGAIGAI